jgi:predicted Zn-dependent protease
MMHRDELLALLRQAVAGSQAGSTEAFLSGETLAVTRWNNNHIHQNLVRENHQVTIRVIDGQRVGLATTNQLDAASLAQAVSRALAHASLQRPNPEAPGMPQPKGPLPAATEAYHESTARCAPDERADGAGSVIVAAQQRGLDSAGTFATSVNTRAVVNSEGVAACHSGTKAYIRTIISDGDNTGYADRLAADVRTIDYGDLAAEALAKATLRRTVEDLPPGRHDTVFEAVALSDLLRFLGYLAFGGRAVLEGRSFMGPQRGQQVMSPLVTIWDDGLDQRGLMIPFDAEGTAKRKVTFIENGVVRDVVHDTASASKAGCESTGHAMPFGRWNAGPMPQNMLMATGSGSREGIIRSTRNGVLVTRFHYTHAPEPMRVVATGTTRDGTYLIRDGELVARLRNLRFTESMIDAFGRIDAVSDQARLARDWWSTFESWLPVVRIRDFTFTGATTF